MSDSRYRRPVALLAPDPEHNQPVALTELPAIEQMTLARVTRVPPSHPEHGAFEPFPVHAWLIRHPDGLILVDTGIGLGHEQLDELYRPDITPLDEALAGLGVGLGEVTALVLSHLHFDHCGQQAALPATTPVYVQADEHRAAQAPRYTVPEWAAIARERLRLVHGDEEIAAGITLLATPGHTPGHQSVLVEAGAERVVLAAQCAFRADELRTGAPRETNLHDPSWHDAARDSLARLRSLGPAQAHLSHDPTVVRLS